MSQNTPVKALAVTLSADANKPHAVAIPADAEQWKTKALKEASGIIEVKNQDQLQAATISAAFLKGIVDETEKTRKKVKAPILDLGKAIDEQAKKFVKELNERISEIEKMISNFIREDNLRKQREEAARKREEARAAQELQEKQAAAAKAEDEANKAKLELQEADTQEEKEAASKAVAAAKIALDAAAFDLMEAEEENSTASAIVIADTAETKVSGGAVRETLKIEVTNIEAFYAWDKARRDEALQKFVRDIPSLVRMEICLGDFKNLIKMMPEEERNKIPGVKITEDTAVSIRSVVIGGSAH